MISNELAITFKAKQQLQLELQLENIANDYQLIRVRIRITTTLMCSDQLYTSVLNRVTVCILEEIASEFIQNCSIRTTYFGSY